MKTRLPLCQTASTALLICLSGTALAQQAVPGAIPGTGSTAVSGTTAAGSAQGLPAPADDSTATTLQPAWIIKPRVALTETLTDNVVINRSANGKQSDLITELAPGINIQTRTARLKGYFDYALRGQFYAKTDYSRTQNSLNTFGTFEAIDNWLFLDFSGIIAQQAISAFGTQSPGSGTINNNSTETATYRLSPFIRGNFGGAVEYLLRYNVSTTRSDATFASDIELSQWSGQLKGSTPFKNLQWSVDGNQQTVDYSNGRKSDAETLRGMLTYAVLPQFRVSMSGGQESNNYASIDQESNSTYGYGFDWNPTERTKVTAFKERRFFGDGHNISFQHRFPMSSIRFTDSRNVSVLPNQFTTAGLGTIYDLYFDQFASLIPDPITRATFVNALLAANGINPNTQVTSGFMTSRATIQRRQELALTLLGSRNSITFLANRNESQSVLAANALNDDFAQATGIRQQGFSLNFAHRLSEISNLNVLASRQESTSSGINRLKTTMTMYQVNVSTKLGAKTTGSLSARRSEFESTTNPYTENAVIGTVTFTY
ncbi:MAG: TIGR03016 family PEP-CTERM system-associated outer membrane protein [Azonexus sp.]|nr:TIGR03016 family PEP-CTERM system-associated outer membrane protein [Azonexus sp.]